MRAGSAFRRSRGQAALLIALLLVTASLCMAHASVDEPRRAGHHEAGHAPMDHQHGQAHLASCHDGMIPASTTLPAVPGPQAVASSPARVVAPIAGGILPRASGGLPPPRAPLFVLHAALLI